MNEQKPLFDFDPHTHARGVDPDTSRAAARSVKAATLLPKIYAALQHLGTGTQHEVAKYLKLPVGMVWKRLSDLKNAGMIEASGSTRPGPSGRQQVAWRVRRPPPPIVTGEPIAHTMEYKNGPP